MSNKIVFYLIFTYKQNKQENLIAIFYTLNHIKGVVGRKKLKSNISMENKKIFLISRRKFRAIQTQLINFILMIVFQIKV